MDEFAPYLKDCTYFIVRNVTPDRNKTIHIFQYPIVFGDTRDLLQIPGVSEDSIRASLLKGQLKNRFLVGDIELVYSNVDLLQFNNCQRDWLISLGFTEGVQIGCGEISDAAMACIDGYIIANHPPSPPGSINYAWKEKISLIGLRNGNNRTFFTPDKFINGPYFGNTFHIAVEHNGKELYENIDFSIGESAGPGSGYDTINIFSLTPNSHSLLYATYTIII